MFAQGGIGQFVHLKQVLKSTAHLVSKTPDADLWVGSCARSAREVQEGDAYFATPPVKFSVSCPDSEDESADLCTDEELRRSVEAAIRRGCKVVVADRPLEGLAVPLLVVPNPTQSYGICCHALWNNPGKSLQLIGISGTYGKTATSYLIAGMLSESGSPVGLIGTLGIYDGEKMFPSTQTTPPPDEIAYWLMRMVSNGCSHAIIEVSSQAIAEEHLAGIKFDAFCLTNIRKDHIDYHHSVESYRRTKLDVFQYVKKKGFAVCNADDRITAAVLPLIDRPVLTTGVKNASEISGMSVEKNIGEQTFLVSAGHETVPLRTRIIGDQQMYNCLTAAALGVGLGIDLRTAVRGIERVDSVPGRMERIDCGQPFGVFVDSAPTPEALAGSLRSLRSLIRGRIFCVLGVGGEHDARLRPMMGRTLEALAEIGVLTADELQAPGASASVEAVEAVLSGAKDSGGIRVIEDRAEAIAWSLSNAESEDCVLVVGRGCSDFQRFLGASEYTLCDRDFVRKWLYENQPCLSPLGGLF